MNRLLFYLGISFVYLYMNSCVRVDIPECPSQFTVRVSVMDKNYSNIEQIPFLVPIDEGLPFGRYVGTVYYTLHRVETGVLIQETSVTNVTGDARDYVLRFDGLPAGEYLLSVWGNTEGGLSEGLLHLEGKEFRDVYLGSKRLLFSSAYQSTDLPLERAKGKLLVMFSHFPPGYARVGLEVKGVFESVNVFFEYGGSTSVSKMAPMQPSVELLLAPSAGGTSQLNLHIYPESSSVELPDLSLSPIEIAVAKGQIVLVDVDYNSGENALDVWLYIRGEWALIHRLDIKRNES